MTFLLLLVFWIKPAQADPCEFYRKYFPSTYEAVCQGGKGEIKRAGASYSSFANSFNVSPASIPTQPSPYGLEAIRSFPDSAQGSFYLGPGTAPQPTQYFHSFSLIKGFQRIGSAVSTAGNSSFYGNDIVMRAYGTPDSNHLTEHEQAKSALPNLNIGTAIAPFGRTTFGTIAPTVGVSVRYNHVTNTIGWGSGLSVSGGWFNLGIGLSREQVSNQLTEAVTFYNTVVGLRLPLIELEYCRLNHKGGFELSPIHIMTGTVVIGPIIGSYAVRRLDYLSTGETTQTHAAVQLQVTKQLSIGFLINYIPGTQSAALQVFL